MQSKFYCFPDAEKFLNLGFAQLMHKFLSNIRLTLNITYLQCLSIHAKGKIQAGRFRINPHNVLFQANEMIRT